MILIYQYEKLTMLSPHQPQNVDEWCLGNASRTAKPSTGHQPPYNSIASCCKQNKSFLRLGRFCFAIKSRDELQKDLVWINLNKDVLVNSGGRGGGFHLSRWTKIAQLGNNM